MRIAVWVWKAGRLIEGGETGAVPVLRRKCGGAVIDCNNKMTALKRMALTARLRRRLDRAGRPVRRARRMVLRPGAKVGRLADWLRAMRLLPVRT